MPIPRRSSTLLLACWSPSFKVAPRFHGTRCLDPHDIDADRGDALAQPEKRQDSDDNDDRADDVDDVVHEISFRNYKRLLPDARKWGFGPCCQRASNQVMRPYAANICNMR
jgi:hypothetical protein